MQTGPPDFSPELDLLERYEEMIDTQVATINGIDDKAAFTARLTAILGGLLIAAASIAATTDRAIVSVETIVPTIAVAVGSVLLLASLVFAILTYLSSRFEYGPSAELGHFIATSTVDSEEYLAGMVSGYSEAIMVNRRVVRANADRFERCLATLLGGIIVLFPAGTMLVLPVGPLVEIGVVLVAIGTVLGTMTYILGGWYITHQAQ